MLIFKQLFLNKKQLFFVQKKTIKMVATILKKFYYYDHIRNSLVIDESSIT